MVFLDTCYSGDVMGGAKALPGDIDGFANDLKNAGPGIVVFTASSGKEFAWEDPNWGHGAFTLALLEAMRGQGGFTKRGVVWVSDIEGYVYERVKELTKGGQKPMVAKPKLIENLPIIELASRVGSRKRRASPTSMAPAITLAMTSSLFREPFAQEQMQKKERACHDIENGPDRLRQVHRNQRVKQGCYREQYSAPEGESACLGIDREGDRDRERKNRDPEKRIEAVGKG